MSGSSPIGGGGGIPPQPAKSEAEERRRAEVAKTFSEALRNPPMPEDNPERPLALEALRREFLGELEQGESWTASDTWRTLRDAADNPMQPQDLATVMDLAEGVLFGGGVGLFVREGVEATTGLTFERADFGPGQMAGLFMRDLALSTNPYTLGATLFADGIDGGKTTWDGWKEGDGGKMAEGGVQIALTLVAAKMGLGATIDDAARAAARSGDGMSAATDDAARAAAGSGDEMGAAAGSGVQILGAAPVQRGRYLINTPDATTVVPRAGEVLSPAVVEDARRYIEELPEILGELPQNAITTPTPKAVAERLADQMTALAKGLSPEHPLHMGAMETASRLREMPPGKNGTIALRTLDIDRLPKFMTALAATVEEAAEYAPRIEEMLKAAD
jgi:hypothetical protein